MTNTLLTTDMILNEALFHLDNELVMAKLVNRDYENQFGKPMKNGETIRIRKPVRGVVRTGATMQTQDITEGRTSLTVATQIGADLEAASIDLTMNISDFGTRYLRPQMIKIANQVDQAVMNELWQHCPNWVGTPANTISTFAGYAAAPKRLDQLAVPAGDRVGVLSPDDYWGLVGSITALSANAPVREALTRSRLGFYGNTDTYMSQNVGTLTTGSWGSSGAINGANQNVTWASASQTDYTSQTLVLKTVGNNATISVGDTFTIANVFAVNPITLTAQTFLRQFTVINAATADGSGNVTVTITPAIIVNNGASGSQYATCSAVPADGAAITWRGSASTTYGQSIVFHPDAVTLAVVPMVRPEGAVRVSQQSYKGISARLIQGYDMTNDLAQWRFDLLYGVKATQPHLACRVNGA